MPPLTPRQIAVLRAYRGHRPPGRPPLLAAYLDAAPSGHAYGVRLGALRRVLERLAALGLLAPPRPPLSWLNGTTLTARGRRVLQRYPEEER